MNELQAIYDRLAKGEFVPIATHAAGNSLLHMAREKLKGEPEAWPGALMVALRVGSWPGAQVLEEAVSDGPPAQKVLALEWAEKGAEHGLKAIRAALVQEDAALIVSALDMLRRHAEPSGTPRARHLLFDARPEVRAAAAAYLGQVGGYSVLTELQSLLPDPLCQTAARDAMDRIEGKIPREEPEPWKPLTL